MILLFSMMLTPINIKAQSFSFKSQRIKPINIGFTTHSDLKTIKSNIPEILEKLNTDNYPNNLPVELRQIPLRVITTSKDLWINEKVPPKKFFREYPELLMFAKKNLLPVAKMDLVIPDARYIISRKKSLEEKPLVIDRPIIEEIAEAYYHEIDRLPANENGKPAKIVALIGAAGSGKTSLIDYIMSHEGELITPDADDIKKMLISKLNLDPNDPNNYMKLHKVSYEISDRVILKAIRNNKNILIQTTGKWSEFPTWLAKLGIEANRKVHMYYNKLPSSIATERSWKREQQIGRGYDPMNTELTGLASMLNFYSAVINNKVDYWEVLSTNNKSGSNVTQVINSDNITSERLKAIQQLIRNIKCQFQAKDHDIFSKGILDYDSFIQDCQNLKKLL